MGYQIHGNELLPLQPLAKICAMPYGHLATGSLRSQNTNLLKFSMQ